MRLHRVTSGFALMLAGSVAAGACSGKVAPAKGQVMVVLQSDMSIPKDFNRVRVDITVRGQIAFTDTFVADASGGISLPGTIAVVAGEEEAPPVEVRVVGINRDGEAQTFSKATTTIPRTRIATLRVPMQWLCTGEVLQFGEGVDAEYESACDPENGQETSCVAGACVPIDIPEEDLPTYSPPEIFGGGQFPNDPSGECFDVQGCFKLGVDLQPDLDESSSTYCQAAITVPRDFEVNFAVKTPPGGAGVCDDDDDEAPCYVVLDQSETFGWTPLEGAEPPTMSGGVGGSSGTASGDGGRDGGTGGKSAPAGGGSSVPIGGSATAGAAFGGNGSGGTGVPPLEPKHITTGTWAGNVYTIHSPDSSIVIEDTPDPSFPLCVSGVVGDTAAAFAMVGFNLDQPESGGDPLPVTPVNDQAGIHISITDRDGNQPAINVMLHSSYTPNSGNGYCTPVTYDTPNFIAWNNFLFGCDGAAYDGVSSLLSLSVAVPGTAGLSTPFDFCIEDVVEELAIGRQAPGQKAQSVPVPPGLRPLQAGDATDGTVVVQFPTAVCDRLVADPTLRLRGTAACSAKTEQTPICGPWSSVPAPQVPDPEGMLPDVGMPGEGGASGMMSGGDAGGEGGQPNAVIVPGSCKVPPPPDHSNPGIASFDNEAIPFSIEAWDNRGGAMFSVGYGTCQAGNGSPIAGANGTPGAIHLTGSGCETSFVDGNSVAFIVPMLTPSGPTDGLPPPPAMMCAYDASYYTGFKFWAKDDQDRDLAVSLLTLDNTPAGGPVPGGICTAAVCEPRRVDVPLTSTWTEHQFSFSQFEVDPTEIIGIRFEPLATSEIYFDLDEVHFIGGALP